MHRLVARWSRTRRDRPAGRGTEPLQRRRPVVTAVAAVALGMVPVPLAAVPAAVPAAAAAPSGPEVENVLATYGGEIRESRPRADGYRHVDTPAMLARLAALRVNTYVYLLWNSPSDWQDFRTEFLPAAARQGLSVWVYLVPPTECGPARCSDPYRTDYLRWAREIATLSTRYPALRAFAIDDFTDNLGLFTPDYMRRMRDTARSVNPGLAFLPLVYYPKVTDRFVAAYAPVVDGMILAYRDDPYRNTQRTDSLPGQLADVAGKLAGTGVPLVLMNYTSALSATPYPPSPGYVATTTRAGADGVAGGTLGGTITYVLPLNPADDPHNVNHAGSGTGRLSLSVPVGVPTRAGNEASARQRITPDPVAARYAITFDVDDNYYRGGGPTDYHLKRLLVDGRAVWQSDVATDRPGYRTVTVDLTHVLAGKPSATIAFQLFERRGVSNFWVDMGVDNVRATGFSVANPGFESSGGWSLSTNARALVPGIEHYLPDRAARAFEQVRTVYGQAERGLGVRVAGQR